MAEWDGVILGGDATLRWRSSSWTSAASGPQRGGPLAQAILTENSSLRVLLLRWI